MMVSKSHREIHICRVYTPPNVKQGKWILVDKLWPRGLKKETLAFDLWLKEITPGTHLRQWFHANPQERWQEFAMKYVEELESNTCVEQVLEMAKHDSVTLFYAAKDNKHNHAVILQEVLCAWPNPPDMTVLD